MGKKILLVEDDLDIQKKYSEKLTSKGFVVLPTDEPVVAIQLARTEKPNIILLDIMIPGKMNGFEILEVLKNEEATKNIPVIVLTNLDTEKEHALSLDVKDYLIKSDLDLSVLVEKVNKYIS